MQTGRAKFQFLGRPSSTSLPTDPGTTPAAASSRPLSATVFSIGRPDSPNSRAACAVPCPTTTRPYQRAKRPGRSRLNIPSDSVPREDAQSWNARGVWTVGFGSRRIFVVLLSQWRSGIAITLSCSAGRRFSVRGSGLRAVESDRRTGRDFRARGGRAVLFGFVGRLEFIS